MILSYNGNWLGFGQYVLGTDIVPIPAYSVRFQFASPQTAESLAGCGSRGTWTRLSDTVWDYTYDNSPNYTSWYQEFDARLSPGGSRRSEVLPSCEIVGSNLTGVTSIESAFADQTNITAVHLYELESGRELNITAAFSGCSGMTSYRIDVCNLGIAGTRLGIETTNNISKFEIGTYTPNYITNQMVLPLCRECKIKNMPNLVSFDEQTFASIGSSQQYASIYIGSAPLVTELDKTFMDANYVTKIDVGSTGVLTDAREAYRNSGIYQVPNLDYSHCTNVRYMLAENPNLTTIPDLDLSAATDATYMCSECTNLTKVPQFVFSGEIRTGYGINSMFSACPYLTDGAYLFYVRMTGDVEHWYDVYPGTPVPAGPYPLEGYDVVNVFYGSYSTEPGWQYIPNRWKHA